MICPRPEMVLAINVALRSASASARDFCEMELHRKAGDAEYISIIKDVMAGYDLREGKLRNQLGIIINYVDTLATMMDRRFNIMSETPDWLFELAKNRKVVGMGLRNAMDGEGAATMCDLCNYLVDCGFPDEIVKAHNDVRAKLRDLQSVVAEFVDMQLRYRKDNNNDAYKAERYNDIMNRIKNI